MTFDRTTALAGLIVTLGQLGEQLDQFFASEPETATNAGLNVDTGHALAVARAEFERLRRA